MTVRINKVYTTPMTSKTLLVVPASIINYNLDSDGTIWFMPTVGDLAGQRIECEADTEVAKFVRFHAERAGFKFDSRGLLLP